MRKKKQYTFTLNKDLVSWFREYSDTTGRTMSSLLNSYILRLKHENKETRKKATTTMDKHLGGKTGLNKDKIAPVKGQKEFISDVTGEVWTKDSITKWSNVINRQARVKEDQDSKQKDGSVVTLPKDSIVFIDDIRGRINPQYRCRDESGKIWFIRTRFIEILLNPDEEKVTEDEITQTTHLYRGGVRVGEQGGDAADDKFKHR